MTSDEPRCFLCGVRGGWSRGAVRMPDGRRAHYACVQAHNRVHRLRESQTTLATNGTRAQA